MGLFSWSNTWIYLVADFAAGAAAVLAFHHLNPDDLNRADPHLHLAAHASDASHPSSLSLTQVADSGRLSIRQRFAIAGPHVG
jgi:glycerol uptake facilitator-like aquaporin